MWTWEPTPQPNELWHSAKGSHWKKHKYIAKSTRKTKTSTR